MLDLFVCIVLFLAILCTIVFIDYAYTKVKRWVRDLMYATFDYTFKGIYKDIDDLRNLVLKMQDEKVEFKLGTPVPVTKEENENANA